MSKLNKLSWEADYCYSEKFENVDFVRKLMEYTVKDAVQTGIAPKIPSDVSPYIEPLYKFPLLSREGEWFLFMKMNYCRYKASQLANEMMLDPSKKLLQTEYDRMMQMAYETRNDIINHNLRLVVSLAKRQRKEGVTFEEWFSNGNISLLRAVNKFDCNKVNPRIEGTNIKFSTYATWAITNGYWQDYSDSQKKQIQYLTDYTSDELQIPDPRTSGHESEHNEEIQLVFKSVKKLDKRERSIINERFGIGCEAATFEVIGRKLGLTKERVRQVEARALRLIKEDLGVPLSSKDLKTMNDRKRHKHKTKV